MTAAEQPSGGEAPESTGKVGGCGEVAMGLLLAWILFMLPCIYFFSVFPPLSEAQRSAVRRGMTEAEVRRICGNPDIVVPGTWHYSSILSLETFQVHFETNHLVEAAFLCD